VDPEAFRIAEGRLRLFYNRLFTDTRKDWDKDAAGLMDKADAAWRKILERDLEQ